MRIFTVIFTTLLCLVDLYLVSITFLLTSKIYDYYSDQLEGAWKLYLFPSTLLLLFIAGIITVVFHKKWGYVFLCFPLLLSLFVQLFDFNTNFLDTTMVDKRNQESIQRLLPDYQK